MAKKRPSRAPPIIKVNYSAARRPRAAKPRERSFVPESSEKVGLLQLNFGRAAHGYGILSALALAFTGILAMMMIDTAQPLPSYPSLGYQDLILWLLPIFVGAGISAHALSLKWAPYKGSRGSGHFLLTAAALVLNFGLLFVMLLLLLGLFTPPFMQLMYFLSTLGIPLTMISMAGSWAGRSGRKAASLFSASFLPLVMLLSLYLGLDISSVSVRPTVVLMYLGGALSIEISGSLLHIIASSTTPYKMEILKASDRKLALDREELQRKYEALEYREKALRGKEAHLESYERELNETAAEVDAKRKEIASLQSEMDKQSREVREVERKLATIRAEVDARVEQMNLKEADLKAVAEELQNTRQQISEREVTVAEREKELKRSGIELSSRSRQMEEKEKNLRDLETRLKDQAKVLDAQRVQFYNKEKDLELRESALNMKAQKVEASAVAKEAERLKELKVYETRLLQKERELGQREALMRKTESDLKERYENAMRIQSSAQSERNALVTKEQELVKKEQAISDREAALEQREKEIERDLIALKEAQTRLHEKEQKYNGLFKDAKLREADFSTLKGELERRIAEVDSREKKLKDVQTNLQREIRNLNESNRQLLARQKEVEAKESELALRELEMETKSREAVKVSQGASDSEEMERMFELREKRLREREEEFKRIMYQREKELEMREQALRAQVQEGVQAAEEVAVMETRAERVKTGTPRLDDLLYGGLPLKSNFLLVGPPFVGKEVVLLNFIAEGLKKGVPAIIVTTSRPPVDVARELAPILPTFIQFEQLGLVRWIDASSTLPEGSRIIREKSVCRVNGPSDFDNIIAIMNDLDEEFKSKGHPYIRVAYLSLSTSIQQTEEREAFSFVQKLVNRLRQTTTVSGFALERGMHTDQQIEALEHMMDGAFYFKQEKQKTMLMVKGIGEVQARDWIPYKFTNKAIMIGSFQLEKIR